MISIDNLIINHISTGNKPAQSTSFFVHGGISNGQLHNESATRCISDALATVTMQRNLQQLCSNIMCTYPCGGKKTRFWHLQLLCLRPHRVEALSLSDVCLSVAYIGPNSRTERPRKTKIGTEVAHVTRDSDTAFKVKKVKGQLVADVLNSQHAGIGATWRINMKILSTCRGQRHILSPRAQLVNVHVADPTIGQSPGFDPRGCSGPYSISAGRIKIAASVT